MKIFIDSGNVDEIREAASWGVVDGVTTNPSFIAKEGRDFRKVIEEICTVVDGPVSAEVTTLKADEMVEQARELSGWHDNVVVKLPITVEGLKALKVASAEGIDVNMTLCFRPEQALLVAKNGARFVSPFVGRMDDIGHDGIFEIVEKILRIYENFDFDTEVLVASVRHPSHVLQAAVLGAHICTMPFSVLDKLIQHPMTDRGLDRFMEDWAKRGEGA